MKEFFLFILLLISYLSEEAFAKPPKKPFIGFSSFAAMNSKYPCSRFLNISKSYSKPAMTVLLSTFGRNTECIKRFLNQNINKPHLLQIHLTNETCRRAKGRCTRDEIKPLWGVDKYNQELSRGNKELKKAIQNRVRFVERNIIPLTNSRTTLMLTTGLEDNFSEKAYLNVQLWIKQAGYRGYLVRNPLEDYCFGNRGSHLCELHSVFSFWSGTSVCRAVHLQRSWRTSRFSPP